MFYIFIYILLVVNTHIKHIMRSDYLQEMPIRKLSEGITHGHFKKLAWLCWSIWMTMQSFADHCLYVIGYHSGGEIKYVEKNSNVGFCLASSFKVKGILTDLWPTDPQHAASSLSHPFASLQELLLTPQR